MHLRTFHDKNAKKVIFITFFAGEQALFWFYVNPLLDKNMKNHKFIQQIC